MTRRTQWLPRITRMLNVTVVRTMELPRADATASASADALAQHSAFPYQSL